MLLLAKQHQILGWQRQRGNHTGAESRRRKLHSRREGKAKTATPPDGANGGVEVATPMPTPTPTPTPTIQSAAELEIELKIQKQERVIGALPPPPLLPLPEDSNFAAAQKLQSLPVTAALQVANITSHIT